MKQRLQKGRFEKRSYALWYYLKVMTVTIDISKEAEARLKQQAESNGKAFDVFVEEMVERGAKEPTWDELVAPFHAETRRLGITYAELDELIDTELAAVRRERRLLSK